MERKCYEVRVGSLVLTKKFVEGWYSMVIHDLEAVESGPRTDEIVPMWYDSVADYLPEHIDALITNIVRSDCKAIYGDNMGVMGNGASPVWHEAIEDNGLVYCLSKSEHEAIVTMLNEKECKISAYRIADPSEIKEDITDILDIRLTKGNRIVLYGETIDIYNHIVNEKVRKYIELVKTWWETDLSHTEWLERSKV